MAYYASWKSMMTKLSNENVLLKTQVESTVQERETIKLEYQKLFNSIKNQDLLMTISELKVKLKLAEKGRMRIPRVATSSSVRRSKSTDSNSKKTVLVNTKSKITSKEDKKSHSSVTSVSNKNDTMNSNVSESKANVLKAKTINVVHDGLNLVCVSCGKVVFLIAHDKCVSRYALSPNSRVNIALFTSPVAMKSSKLGATLVVVKSRFSVATPPKATNKIVDRGCSKHMTRNLKLLRNFVEKFMGTILFGNDNFAAITRYRDYVQGNLTICHVYYVEGLGHNIFSVGQFYDGDLEIAFRSNTCYVRNLEGVVLLTGSRDSNIYTISISEMAASSPVCLLSKATSRKS
ncbi:hypothetical protein Tco_1049690 [Tanacetum coccineum]